MPEPLRFPDRPDLPLDRPRIMGIVNATPDSFSDGGRYNDPEAAAAHALAMVDEGAEIIDVGGESTRPGSSRVEVDQQIARTAGVVAAIRKALDNAGHDAVVISIDTTRAEVASAALEAGASMLNDVAAGREDPAMLTLAAEQGRPICLMHMQGEPGNMQDNPTYDDVVGEVEAFLLERRAAAEAAGVERSQILLDPGIGFGKRTDHNLALLAGLKRLAGHGSPVLLGTSRKRFMGDICTGPDGNAPKPADLVGATCATTTHGVLQGVAIFRVHDVRANRQAADVAAATREAGSM